MERSLYHYATQPFMCIGYFLCSSFYVFRGKLKLSRTVVDIKSVLEFVGKLIIPYVFHLFHLESIVLQTVANLAEDTAGVKISFIPV